MPVTIVMVDDHPIVRQGLRYLLEAEPEFRVVGEAEDGIEALQLIERIKPDVLVLDMMMPSLNGLEVLRRVENISPATRTIILSMQSADAYVLEALKNGAVGYVLKETGPSELVNAVHEVVEGNQYLSPKLSRRLLTSEHGILDTPSDAYDTLTAREREILQMTVEGRTSHEIGEKLMLSPRTIEVHRSNFMNKLGIHNQAELIRFAIKRGILQIND
jgi:two-component system, NarL family, response regulator NreC